MADQLPIIGDLDEVLADQVLETLGNSCYLDVLETGELHDLLPQLHLDIVACPPAPAVDLLPELVELSRALTRHAYLSRSLAREVERVKRALFA